MGALMIGGIFVFTQTAFGEDYDLLQNGSFDGVMMGWNTDSDWADPSSLFVPDEEGQYGGGHIQFDNRSPFKQELFQSLNVSHIAGQSVRGSFDVRADWVPEDEKALSLVVTYSKTDGSTEKVVLANPDNSSLVTSSYKTISGSFTFPPDADRLVSLAIIRNGAGRFHVDNVKLTSNTLWPDEVPVFSPGYLDKMVYNQTKPIAGKHFGETKGKVLVGGSENGVVVESWSDDEIRISVHDPCPGGAVTVVRSDQVRTTQRREIEIASPFFTAKWFNPDGVQNGAPLEQPVVVVKGDTAEFDVDIDCFNGLAAPAGIRITADNPSGVTITPSVVPGDGGCHVKIDTTGVAPGIFTYRFRASMDGFEDRQFDLALDVREAAGHTLEYRESPTDDWTPVPGLLELSSQNEVQIRSILRDSEGNDITPYAHLAYSTCNPDVVKVHNSNSPGLPSVVMPQDNGTCAITTRGPGGATWTDPVAVSVPDDPKIAILMVDPLSPGEPIDNSGTSRFHLKVTASQPMTSFLWDCPETPFETIDGQYSDENRSFTALLQVKRNTLPGTYKIKATAVMGDNSASRSTTVDVVNEPGTGWISGHCALMRQPPGTAGKLKLYDASSGELVLEHDMSGWAYSQDYTIPCVPPGTYKFLWVVDEMGGPGYPPPQWFPNAYEQTDAAGVTVTAGAGVPDVDFFLDLRPDMMPPATPALEPVFDPVEHKFQCRVANQPGFLYELWKSLSAEEGTWYKAGGAGTGSAEFLTLEDENATAPKSFYKVVRK